MLFSICLLSCSQCVPNRFLKFLMCSPTCSQDHLTLSHMLCPKSYSCNLYNQPKGGDYNTIPISFDTVQFCVQFLGSRRNLWFLNYLGMPSFESESTSDAITSLFSFIRVSSISMDWQTTNMLILIHGWRTFNMGIIRSIFVNAYYKHLKIVHAQLKASSIHANTYKVEDSFCLNLRVNNPQ